MVELENVFEIRTGTVSFAVCKTQSKAFQGSLRATELAEKYNVLLYGIVAEAGCGGHRLGPHS